MNKLLALRERSNLTQEELSEKSGISVRTIQRIESGQTPKGYTLKTLATVLQVDETALMDRSSASPKWPKAINLLPLMFMFAPPLNVLVPLAIVYFKKTMVATDPYSAFATNHLDIDRGRPVGARPYAQ